MIFLIFVGGCKHAVAFLMWMNRKTENPSPTEVKCYWTAPRLSKVGSSKKFITTAELAVKMKQVQVKLPDNTLFLQTVIKIAEEKQIENQCARYFFDIKERKYYKLSIHQLLIDFMNEKVTAAEQFIFFASQKMSDSLCREVIEKTKLQSDDLLWFELRYARVTASTLYAAANCSTTNGTLVSKISGASKKFDTESMKRGRE